MAMDGVNRSVPGLDAALLRQKECFMMVLEDGRRMRCRLLEVGQYNLRVKTEDKELFIPKKLIKYYVLDGYETARTESSGEAEKVNINTASVEELSQLSGLGAAISERIIAHRDAHGPFEVKEELLQIKGIGRSRFAELEGKITL